MSAEQQQNNGVPAAIIRVTRLSFYYRAVYLNLTFSDGQLITHHNHSHDRRVGQLVSLECVLKTRASHRIAGYELPKALRRQFGAVKIRRVDRRHTPRHISRFRGSAGREKVYYAPQRGSPRRVVGGPCSVRSSH